MNTNISTRTIRRISIALSICALAGIFWVTGTAHSPWATQTAQAVPTASAQQLGDNEYSTGSLEAAMEAEFYLPHVVDLAAGSDFVPVHEETLTSENATDLTATLTGHGRQCSFNHGALAMNDCR